MDVDLKHPIYNLVGQAADRTGVEAYAVGGVVRDYFLQRPCTDIDIVCVGSGIDLATEVAQHCTPPVHVQVYKNFGTASFVYVDEQHTHWQVEFVGARRESYRKDSRKPIVENGSLADDLTRRDFTINAMAVRLGSENHGQLVDPFGGIKDLDNGLLRTPVDPLITFSDDPLRMMRAVRFAAQLGFHIAPNAYNAICQHAERLRIVSHERITTEINKILLSPKPSIGLQLMEDTGLMQLILPEISQLKGTETVEGHSHKDNFVHTMEVVDNVARHSDDLWLRWAALLHDIGKPATKRFDKRLGWTFHGHEAKGAHMVPALFKRLRLPLDTKLKYVEKLVMLHLRPIILAEDIVTDSAVRRLLFDAGDDIDDLMTLCEADITSKNSAKVRRYLRNFELVRQKLVELEERDRIRNFQPPINGEDIMHAFNIGPCQEIGVIKDAIKDAILDGQAPNSRPECWVMMVELGRNIGLTLHDDNPNWRQSV
ncbi:MAG: HD domain-containing protein [Bacteroidales bacterium]|nr:HD domain-containing protein [Bacteroidales bacterium]